MDYLWGWLKFLTSLFRRPASKKERVLKRLGGSLPSAPTLDQQIEFFQVCLQESNPNDPDNVEYFRALAFAFQDRYGKTREVEDLEKMIGYADQELRMTNTSHRTSAFATLASGHFNRYLLKASLPDLEYSMKCAHDGIKEASPNTLGLARCEQVLAECLRVRYHAAHDPDDLKNSLDFAQKALRSVKDESEGKYPFLGTLDNVYDCRYESSGELSDLDISIQYLGLALKETPSGHPRRAFFLHSAGTRYGSLFHRLGLKPDLEKSVQYHEQAFEVVSKTTEDPVKYCDGLAVALFRRYGSTDNPEDLDEAIRLGERAATECREKDSNKIDFLQHIGSYYGTRYDRLGSKSDLEMSVKYTQQAIDVVTSDRSSRALALLNHSKELRKWANLHDSQADLNTAKLHAEEALESMIDSKKTSKLFLFYSNLGVIFFQLYENSGHSNDLDKAIENYRAAVFNCPKGHPDRWKLYLIQLGLGLSARFGISLQIADLQEGIDCISEAAADTPAEYPKRGVVFNNLGGVYLRRYRIAKVDNDLEEAITNYRLAVDSMPIGHVERPWHQIFLASALCDKFRQLGDDTILNEAIGYCQVEQSKPARKGAALDLLGRLYLSKFEKSGSTPDLKESIRYSKFALDATKPKSPARMDCLSQIGGGFKLLFDNGHLDDDLKESSKAFLEILDDAELSTRRLLAGLSLVFNYTSQEHWGKAANIIDRIVTILPEVILPSHSRDDAQNMLRTFYAISSSAPTIFLKAGRSEMQALEILENFRGIIASLTMDTRIDISFLKEKHEDLWRRYVECRNQLAALNPGAPSSLGLSEEPRSNAQSDSRSTKSQLNLQASLKDVLHDIRNCKGFEDFLLPPKGDAILKLARDGPVVCFNTSSWGSHVFLVTTTTIEVMELQNIELAHISSFMDFSRSEALANRDPKLDDSDDEEDVQDTSRQMVQLWDHIVKPVLKRLGLLDSDAGEEKLPRIWWIGGGIMSLIPFHAAGHHTPNSTENTLSHAISSYAPTLKMLQYLRNRTPTPVYLEPRKILVVTMPTTPGGHRPLNTKAEAAAITKYRSSSCHITHLEQEYKAKVILELATCTIAHIASHGLVDPIQPGKSALLLGRETVEKLTVDEIISAIIQSGPNGAQLAYLSACSTADVKDLTMLHESIHLASAFQLAGFQNVVGTLWKAHDNTAVAVAGRFYEKLFRRDGIDGDSVARALHGALLDVKRDAGSMSDFVKWGCFIHIGC